MTVMCTKITVSEAQNDLYENFCIITVISVKTTVILMQDNGHFGITTATSVKKIKVHFGVKITVILV